MAIFGDFVLEQGGDNTPASAMNAPARLRTVLRGLRLRGAPAADSLVEGEPYLRSALTPTAHSPHPSQCCCLSSCCPLPARWRK